ncbi:hypothetical protein [Roseibium litorale]|uniref:Uncharacterized protein n=1 Tax=Roseibium litorale TaxID=2803841 RepID=A0ABR9CRV0_9HYPH|nr:hypothetical protein [Roseibium litorale]MBD8893413.1 hypothetical protein [Roseibium litorale]
MFARHALQFFQASRFSPFTRPVPSSSRPERLIEGDHAGRSREARLAFGVFSSWHQGLSPDNQK